MASWSRAWKEENWKLWDKSEGKVRKGLKENRHTGGRSRGLT